MGCNKILKDFSKDIDNLQFKIEHYKLYNIYTFFVRLLLKNGIMISKGFPFILSSVIVLNSSTYKNNKIFKRDIVQKPGYIQTIDMTNGNHEENVCVEKGKNKIEYSNGWTINNQGLYERIVVSFKVNNRVDLENLDDILNMPEDKLRELLTVKEVKTVIRKELSEEDKIYNDDTIIVTQYIKSKDVEVLRKETGKENFEHSMMYILSVWLFTIWFKKVKKFLIKTVVEDKLGDNLAMHQYVYEVELDDLKKILEVKKDNLMLLQNESQDKDRSLIKVRKK